MLKEIKTTKELEEMTEIQEWENGCNTFNDMVYCICESTSLSKDVVEEWAQEEVDGYFDIYGDRLFDN